MTKKNKIYTVHIYMLLKQEVMTFAAWIQATAPPRHSPRRVSRSWPRGGTCRTGPCSPSRRPSLSQERLQGGSAGTGSGCTPASTEKAQSHNHIINISKYCHIHLLIPGSPYVRIREAAFRIHHARHCTITTKQIPVDSSRPFFKKKMFLFFRSLFRKTDFCFEVSNDFLFA